MNLQAHPFPSLHSLQAVEPCELLLPLTSESASLFLTHTLDLPSFSLWPGGIPWCFLFSPGARVGVGRGLAWWVPGEDLPSAVTQT